jgi:hypothetical protein
MTKSIRQLILPSVLALALSGAPPATAQDEAAPPQSDDQREPAAMAALDRMGEALRKQMNFDVSTDVTAEDVLESGQKLQYNGTLEIVARRPGKLRMIYKIAGSERQLYYNGKSLTLYAPRENYFATAEAPDTIGKTLAAAEDEYGLIIPLADLFTWGEDPELINRVKSAFYVGKEPIGDQTCEHYAMRQENVDWQIWLREGGEALPCKLVITSTGDEAQPQVTAQYKWLQATDTADDFFTFKPSDGARRIAFDLAKNDSSGKGN